MTVVCKAPMSGRSSVDHPRTRVARRACFPTSNATHSESNLLQSVDSSAVLSLPAPRHTRTNVGYSRDMHTRLLCVGPSRAWAASDARRIVANPSCIRILSPLASPRHTARSSGAGWECMLRTSHSLLASALARAGEPPLIPTLAPSFPLHTRTHTPCTCGFSAGSSTRRRRSSPERGGGSVEVGSDFFLQSLFSFYCIPVPFSALPCHNSLSVFLRSHLATYSSYLPVSFLYRTPVVVIFLPLLSISLCTAFFFSILPLRSWISLAR
ncbi:hypothetical protein B0H10DRAFT_886767 [Mycena sp. CBHHK59/15]|nr:hypothetical protein B0H10DRAFT_886767 [Mycena sp. CBHHK59/15]